MLKKRDIYLYFAKKTIGKTTLQTPMIADLRQKKQIRKDGVLLGHLHSKIN